MMTSQISNKWISQKPENLDISQKQNIFNSIKKIH